MLSNNYMKRTAGGHRMCRDWHPLPVLPILKQSRRVPAAYAGPYADREGTGTLLILLFRRYSV